MSYLKDSLHIGFNDLEFNGLKFGYSEEDHPWKSQKELNEHFDSLIEDGSDISSLRYKNIFKRLNKVEIHIKLSHSIVLGIISNIALGVAIILGLTGTPIIGLSVLGFSFLSFLGKGYSRRRARELYVGLHAGPDLVDLLFYQEREARKTK
jgi:hypothetical protein